MQSKLLADDVGKRARTALRLGVRAASDATTAAPGVSDPGERGADAWLLRRARGLAMASTREALASGRGPR